MKSRSEQPRRADDRALAAQIAELKRNAAEGRSRSHPAFVPDDSLEAQVIYILTLALDVLPLSPIRDGVRRCLRRAEAAWRIRE